MLLPFPSFSFHMQYCAGILEQSVEARERVGLGLLYRPTRLLGIDSWAPQKFKIPALVLSSTWARICKHLRSPGIDSKELIPPAYVAWQADTSNRVVHRPARLGINSWAPWKVYKYRLNLSESFCHTQMEYGRIQNKTEDGENGFIWWKIYSWLLSY
jgi:hypothetical protein